MKQFFIILIVFLLSSFQKTLIPQIYSEAPIQVLDGIVLTDMFYVKFKHSDVISFNKEKEKLTISNNFPEIYKIINKFCFFRHINMDDIQIHRAIPRAADSKMGTIDSKTREKRKFPDLSKVYMVIFPRLVDIETIVSELKSQSEIEYVHGPVQW